MAFTNTSSIIYTCKDCNFHYQITKTKELFANKNNNDYICNQFYYSLKLPKMDIVDRLTKFRDHTGLTNSQFADRAGIPRPTLSQFLSGRNKRLSDDLTAKLHAAYPELNVLWLLFGEGDMVAGTNIQFSEPQNSPKFELKFDHVSDFEDPVPYGTPRQTPPQEYSNQPVHPPVDPQQSSAPDLSAVLAASASAPGSSSAANSVFTAAKQHAKKIQSIMVFYTDSSFETFYPREEK